MNILKLVAQLTKTEGFKILWRVNNPLNETGRFVAEATDISKMWEHAAPWIKGFGCMCEVEAVFSDEQFVTTAKKNLLILSN